MTDSHAGLRYKGIDLGSHFLNALNTVVQVIHLTATSQLPFNGFTYQRLTVLNDICLDREAILRWRLNDR
ncbi:hypothetical protein D3C73_1581030 [compost metagenome]